jgi:uncharacterized membrane protein YfcA
MDTYLLLLGAGLLGGAMNAIAGGGSFITFPALVFAGLPSVSANASSTLALFPGALASVAAYRKDPMGLEGVSMRALLVISLIGGLIGAVLLLVTPSPTFDLIVPWLLLIATVTFAFGPKVGAWLRARMQIRPRDVLVIQFLLTIYSGYFGGGVSIMILATWSLMVVTDLAKLNPTRIVTVAVSNTAAVVCFVLSGQIRWLEMSCVLVGATLGGYFGAQLAKRMSSLALRRVVIVIAVTMTVVFFARAF